MMKLLYVPTGNVFTLPDEEALKYRNQDSVNYKILDAGYIQEEAPVQLKPQTVQELVMQADNTSEEPTKEDITNDVVVEDKQEDLSKLSKDALLAYCRRLNIKGMTKGQKTKAQMIEAIQKATIKNVVGE